MKRKRFPLTKLRRYVTNTIQIVSLSSSPSSSTLIQYKGISYSIAHFVNCDRFFVGHRNFLVAISTGVEPRSFKEAMQDPGWREEMHKEIKALEENDIWSMKTLPRGKKALGSRWVNKIKYNSDG